MEVWVRVPPLAPSHLVNEVNLVDWGARRVHQATCRGKKNAEQLFVLFRVDTKTELSKALAEMCSQLPL